jgi:hypothetical protein
MEEQRDREAERRVRRNALALLPGEKMAAGQMRGRAAKDGKEQRDEWRGCIGPSPSTSSASIALRNQYRRMSDHLKHPA